MANNEQENGLHFDLPKNRSSVIKVIGVGGGGSNAVNHMKKMGIKGVDFMVCNTDAQALEHSAVENRIQLGIALTEGLGAGANPEVGRDSATESLEEIREVLKHNTRMVFITAGMGGGTGTGAAPVIAQLAREMGILTVGIVTKPFRFEGKTRAKQAQEGIDLLRGQVDSLVVINNDKLREVYGNLSFRAGFAKADEVLANAAKGIAEVITYHFTTNIDLRDVRTVLENSGTAIMGSATAAGENRAKDAVINALDSPLLNDNHIEGAKNVLLMIVSGEGDQEITMDEMSYINEHIQDEAGGNANVILGIGIDEKLEDAINVTIIATGFPSKQVDAITGRAATKIVHSLNEDQPIEKDIFENKFAQVEQPKIPAKRPEENRQPDLFSEMAPKPAVVHDLYEEEIEIEEEQIAEETSIETAESQTETIEEITPEAETETNFPLAGNKIEEEKETVFLSLDVEDDFEIEDEDATEITAVQPSAPIQVNQSFEEDDDSDDFTFELDDIEGDGIELHTEPHAEVTPAIETVEPTEDPMNLKIDDVLESKEDEKVKIELIDNQEKNMHISPDAPLSASPKKPEVVKHTLEDLIELEKSFQIKKTASVEPEVEKKEEIKPAAHTKKEEYLDFKVGVKEDQPLTNRQIIEDSNEDIIDQPLGEISRKKIIERRERLEQFSYKFNAHKNNMMDKEPAFKRQGLQVEVQNYSSNGSVSGMSVNGSGDETSIRSNNSFLHDNVD